MILEPPDRSRLHCRHDLRSIRHSERSIANSAGNATPAARRGYLVVGGVRIEFDNAIAGMHRLSPAKISRSLVSGMKSSPITRWRRRSRSDTTARNKCSPTARSSQTRWPATARRTSRCRLIRQRHRRVADPGREQFDQRGGDRTVDHGDQYHQEPRIRTRVNGCGRNTSQGCASFTTDGFEAAG